jgi:hypothetical protein
LLDGYLEVKQPKIVASIAARSAVAYRHVYTALQDVESAPAGTKIRYADRVREEAFGTKSKKGA